MNKDVFRTIIETIREKTELAEVIGETVKLRRCGSVFKGRSPFNRDEDPSLVVWPHTRTWRDYSNGGSVGGDCFDFVMKKKGCNFMEAVYELALRSGIDIPSKKGDPEFTKTIERYAERRRIHELLTISAVYYHSVLPHEIRNKLYEKHYGFTNETVDELLLGWSDGHLIKYITELAGASIDEALSTGLFVQLTDGRIVDFFCKRLIFPYWVNGKVVYFIGRKTKHTEDHPWEVAKYRKLPVHSERYHYISPVVGNDYFFNEDSVRGANELLVTEGITDAISAKQAGIPCISPVTTHFRERDVPRLIQLTRHVKRTIICNDNEESGAGESGAIKTAQALYDAGRDVRIAVIPRSEGKSKIDVNELVVAEGPKALQSVLEQAERLPEFLIKRIPEDTPKIDLPDKLEPVLDLLSKTGPVIKEYYAELLKERFKLKLTTVNKLLSEALHRSSLKNVDSADKTDVLHVGEVFEKKNCYCTFDSFGRVLKISSFCIEPIQRIVVESGDIIEANIKTDHGAVYRQVRFPRDAWHSSRNFLKTLRSADLQWTGSDANVQGVLRLVASYPIPNRQGTTNLGYHESSGRPLWVTPDGIIGSEVAGKSNDEVTYVNPGASLAHRVCYRSDLDRHAEAAAAAVMLPHLLQLNTPEVVLPIIGWFFAAPLKPRIMARLKHFPILIVWGSPGSGKTTLIMDVFWPLMGVVSAEPYSATETEFALLKLLSSTNSLPVFIDEYKPFDMPRHRRNTLHRYMRRLYMGEVEERGRANQTIVTYRLAAPLCLAGETRPIEPALVERILTANPDKDQLVRDPIHTHAFSRIRSIDPSVMAPGIIRFLLGRNTAADIDFAAEQIEILLGNRDVPYRVRDNLIVMLMGLQYFKEYAQQLGIEIDSVETGIAVDAILDDLLEGGGSNVKSGLDYFIEELSVMAVSGKIECNRHYTYNGGLLAIHFPSCHAAYCEHCRATNFEGEVPDRKALRRQVVENYNRGGYVCGIDELVCFNDREDRRRAVLIDIEEVKQSLTVDDFPRDMVREPANFHYQG